ncbi:hypothetical protein BH24GEM2_BH24GEM2_10580 [soil metagenome]
MIGFSSMLHVASHSARSFLLLLAAIPLAIAVGLAGHIYGVGRVAQHTATWTPTIGLLTSQPTLVVPRYGPPGYIFVNLLYRYQVGNIGVVATPANPLPKERDLGLVGRPWSHELELIFIRVGCFREHMGCRVPTKPCESLSWGATGYPVDNLCLGLYAMGEPVARE